MPPPPCACLGAWTWGWVCRWSVNLEINWSKIWPWIIWIVCRNYPTKFARNIPFNTTSQAKSPKKMEFLVQKFFQVQKYKSSTARSQRASSRSLITQPLASKDEGDQHLLPAVECVLIWSVLASYMPLQKIYHPCVQRHWHKALGQELNFFINFGVMSND